MATQKELDDLQESLKPHVAAAIARGEDLSTPEDMLRFVLRVLEQSGYAQRGERFVQTDN
jgi:hypothetical protein